jgi:alpha/beta superfamily hydrolase
MCFIDPDKGARDPLMENKITFESGGIQIEGLLHQNSEKGVIVTHPHPLYGGDMYNPVVETISDAFRKRQFTTLRFNFRGVGGSQGTFAEGIGELEDLKNAFAFLTTSDITEIHLAGYSFGAWVNAHIDLNDGPLSAMLMVSPPVHFIDFKSITKIPKLELVITGDRDDIAPSGLIKKMLPAWNPAAHLEIIPGADHFYFGFLDTLACILELFLKDK